MLLRQHLSAATTSRTEDASLGCSHWIKKVTQWLVMLPVPSQKSRRCSKARTGPATKVFYTPTMLSARNSSKANEKHLRLLQSLTSWISLTCMMPSKETNSTSSLVARDFLTNKCTRKLAARRIGHIATAQLRSRARQSKLLRLPSNCSLAKLGKLLRHTQSALMKALR